MHRFLIAIVLLCVTGCSNDAIDARLQALSGNDYLVLSDPERRDLIAASLDRFTTWRFWDRPDLCDAVLNEDAIERLYDAAARNAGDKPMMFSFVVYANEECVGQGQLLR